MSNLAGNLALVVSFFTTLPLPGVLSRQISEKSSLSSNIVYFPLVGLLIGTLIASVWFTASAFLAPSLSAGTALLCGFLLTGALHEDGLADTADGLGATTDRERSLEIMRDSRIGTYGVVALIATIGLRWNALANLDIVNGVAALACVHMISRTAIPIALKFSTYARATGLAQLAQGNIALSDFAIALAVGLLLTLAICGWSGLLAAAITLAIATIFCSLIHHRLGGYTGDTLGATQQIAEVSMLVLLAGFWA